jgi:hypothetical protein
MLPEYEYSKGMTNVKTNCQRYEFECPVLYYLFCQSVVRALSFQHEVSWLCKQCCLICLGPPQMTSCESAPSALVDHTWLSSNRTRIYF